MEGEPEGCFCAVGRAESGLKFFKQAVVFEVVLKMDSNNFFKDLGQEWKVGYRPEVCKDFRAQGGFFEKRSYYCSFQIWWNVTVLK